MQLVFVINQDKVSYFESLTSFNVYKEKASEDIKRKLEMFEEKWKNGNLSESVKIKISHLAAGEYKELLW